MNAALRRFPWPANPSQRYSIESPFLAVVNARGPWAVWRHKDAANPPYIPLCRDLTDKDFWKQATNDERVFAVTVWLGAAREDMWGIVWGDPVRLCHQWRLDANTFTARLEWMIGAGLACYLTPAEAEAVRSWRHRRDNSNGGEYKGGQDKTRQDKQDKQASQESAADSQAAPLARAIQVADSEGQGQEQAQPSKPSKGSKGSKGSKAHAKEQEPANLPKSDLGAVAGKARAGRTSRQRPPSDRLAAPTRIGDLLAWDNPRAVEFGRRMYEAIHGRKAPPDLTAAIERDRADVGVWAHYWQQQVEPSLPTGLHSEFVARCVRDVTKKQRAKGIKDLGRVARGRIVPGILAVMCIGPRAEHN